MCQKEFKTKRGNTSTIWRHAKHNHKAEVKEAQSEGSTLQPTLFEDIRKNPDTYAKGSPMKESLDKALITMIAMDLQPLSIVRYSRLIDKKYQLPSRARLTNVLLPSCFEEVQQKFNEDLSHAASFCIITDL